MLKSKRAGLNVTCTLSSALLPRHILGKRPLLRLISSQSGLGNGTQATSCPQIVKNTFMVLNMKPTPIELSSCFIFARRVAGKSSRFFLFDYTLPSPLRLIEYSEVPSICYGWKFYDDSPIAKSSF